MQSLILGTVIYTVGTGMGGTVSYTNSIVPKVINMAPKNTFKTY
jgi:hypothetical protein